MELPEQIDRQSFAYTNLVGADRWFEFTPSFTGLTLVGTATYVGRYRTVGRKVEFQVSMVSTGSLAFVAGTTYMALPVTPAKGLSGEVKMSDATTKNAVGEGHIDVDNGRAYLPLQPASSDTFLLAGWYEI